MSKIAFYLRNLFPHDNFSTYTENGERRVSLWRMWFGRCYNIRNYRISEIGA